MPFVLAFRHSPNEDWTNLSHPVYQDGASAQAEAKDRNTRVRSWNDSVRYKVVRLSDEDPLAWRLRQEALFADGTYKKCPWHESVGGHHRWYDHVDPNDPTKVRFFANSDDGERNRPTSMSPGRFYLRYIDDYPDTGVVEGYCAQMGLDMTVSKLQIEMDADGIERIYTSGPHSCMAYPFDQDKFDSPYHPVRNYAAGDLGVAYITRGGDVTARCMVWPDKKIHGRIYGDRERLVARLTEEGYTEDWNFIGAKLILDRDSNGRIISPYVDGADLEGTIDGTYIKLVHTDDNTLMLKGAEGLASAQECEFCEASGVHLQWNDDEDRYVCDNH